MKITKNYLKKIIKESLINEVRYKKQVGSELPIQQFYLWFKKISKILPNNIEFSCKNSIHSSGTSILNLQQTKNVLINIIREDKKEKNDTYAHIWYINWKPSSINYLADKEIRTAKKGIQEFDLEKLYSILAKDKRLANHISGLFIGLSSKWDSDVAASISQLKSLD